MGNLVSIRLRIIAAAWMGSVAEPGDLGAACGAPALDENEAFATCWTAQQCPVTT